MGYAICEYKQLGDNENRHFDKIFTDKQRAIAKEQQQYEDPYVHLARVSLVNMPRYQRVYR